MNSLDPLEYYRLIIFAATIFLLFMWELMFPRRKLIFSKIKRWANNFTLVGINTIIVKLAFPIVAIGAAQWSQTNQFGLLHKVNFPIFLNMLLTIILLDFFIYLQHVILHKVPLLWRLHRVHHMDKDLDLSTAVRFHPIEIMISMLFKIGLIVLFGFNLIGVFMFEVILSSSSLFNHSNIYIPHFFDRIIKTIIVTPDMHRVHHSEIPSETNSNYGFFFSFWDRLFKTFCKKEFSQQTHIVVGLKEFTKVDSSHFLKLIINPFKKSSKK